jgi:carboxylesterase
MKFKKTILFILILIILIIISRLIDTYSAKYLDSRYPRENGIMKGTQEIYIENGDEAVLLLHGLTANPASVKELAEFFSDKGYTVYAPVIKGHGTSVFDLEKTNYLDWRKSAEDAYLKLYKDHKKIYLVGTSLGGLLSLDLAANHKVNGVIIINTPINLKSSFVKIIPLVYLINPYNVRGLFSLEELPVAVELKLYDSLPVKSVAQLMSYLEYVKTQLKKINTPVLVVQGLKDDIVDPDSILFIINNINSKNKDVLFLKDSSHINLVNEDKNLFKQRSYKFLKDTKNV